MTELEKAAGDKYPRNAAFIEGARWAFQNRDVEKVLFAACKYILDDEELVTVGVRHHHASEVADKYFWADCVLYDEDAEQLYIEFRRTETPGFITTQNRFVDREEAAEIAFSAGQIASPKTELHSEDLY